MRQALVSAPMNLDQLDPKKYIIIKGAKVNNLKDLSVAIPRNKMVVITGLSGSGKSSLAFDTLFAEGQRMYVESLSAYARQFLGRMEKPEVEYIKGVSPAIAIEQKVNTRNPRSTVGTTTEIYDYLKLLFARIGITYSPKTGKIVTKDSVSDVVDYVYKFDESSKLMILSPLRIKHSRDLEQELKILLSKGYSRLLAEDKVVFIEDLLVDATKIEPNVLQILIDRTSVQLDPKMPDGRDEDNQFRLADSIETAFFEGEGTCVVNILNQEIKTFSDNFERDGIRFAEPSVNLFTFNNPYGACRTCEGFGKILGIDEDLVVPDKSLSVYEGAVAPWRSETMKKWLNALVDLSHLLDFPIHRAYSELNQEQRDLLWHGNEHFDGIDDFFKYLASKSHKIQYRVLISRYRGRTICPDCRGTRLRKDAGYVKINDHSITDLVLMPITGVVEFFENLKLEEYQNQVAHRILLEIKNRLDYLDRVGLGYLTLNRISSTLSGGEFQRIKLATSLGSALVGSMYILDEPSIGLHSKDTERLISILKSLRNIGNTVIVVEHEEEIMRAADQIIDIGPGAGSHGGELVFQGTQDELKSNQTSFTARYLNGIDRIKLPASRRKWSESIKIVGARENNLKNLTVEFPLNTLTVITGVSGSGKSTLVRDILYPALGNKIEIFGQTGGKHDHLEGDYHRINRLEFVDQNPIGKSSRSNPVTYVKAYDPVRQLFADQPIAKQRGYKPSHFSFNVDGGRCEVCQGEGIVKIEMQFMADIQLKCESCKGSRFKDEILEVEYKNKNIAGVLELTVEESLEFFQDHKTIINRLQPLNQVGLGYVRLGQSSNSLSGGEAQRVKLASFLGKGSENTLKGDDQVLFIFDEPTTGLHFHDINKLLSTLEALIDQGNSVIIIEHNLEVIKCADWIIDLGPEGGEKGGYLNFAGTPEDLVKQKGNYTARYLREKLV
ncbi:MAG: excinuclease ABC subunit UvrA [Bacteroidetes bacterium]|nr:excinuclease ABC subunit UvrA [Bacteroidota bacterium]